MDERPFLPCPNIDGVQAYRLSVPVDDTVLEFIRRCYWKLRDISIVFHIDIIEIIY